MPRSRRRILRASITASTVGFVGCLSSVPGGPGYPTPTDCPDDPRVPEPDRHPDGADLPPVPAPPDALTDDDAVVAYVDA